MTPAQGNNQGTCPKCNGPLPTGVKFCETCGARTLPPPACAQCGAPVVPGVKFCETCGTRVETLPAAPRVMPYTPASPPQPAAPPTIPAPSPAAESGKPDKKPEPFSPIKDNAVDKKPPDLTKDAAPQEKKSGLANMPKNQTMIIGGIAGIIIIAIIVFLVVLPMLSGPGSAGQGTQAPGSVSTSPSPGSATVSWVTDPTQVPPTNLQVTYQAERDPLTGIVTVTFTGGPGKNGVREVFIRLTTGNGQVITRTFTPAQIGSAVSLQGTKKTDRIEVTANFYNGDQYKIIDKILEPRQSF